MPTTGQPLRYFRYSWNSRQNSRKPDSLRFFHASRLRNEEDGHGIQRPPLTSERYPLVKRNALFSKITPDHVEFFKHALGNSGVIDGVTRDAENDLEQFNYDWMRRYRGQSRVVLKPNKTSDVSRILKYCNDHHLAIVPQGGNTGLVGGSVPVFDEVVISLSRMNQIRSFNDTSGILVLDAGVILEVADNFLAERQYLFPLDLGAKGSCQVGGNISTNAGGLRLLRYGSLHGTVIGIEAVLPDGTILEDLSQLRKNNTGYDLKHLFIGAEGTIGIVTGISIICPQRPKATNVAILGLQSYAKVKTAYQEAKHQLGEILSAFEMMDSFSQEIVRGVTRRKPPLESASPFYCLIETSGSDVEHDKEKLERFLMSITDKEIALEGTLAQDERQGRALWAWREGIAEALSHYGPTYKYDLSIPQDELYEVVEAMRRRLISGGLISSNESAPVVGVLGYGHMGDCNIHLNVITREYSKKVEEAVEPWIFEWVAHHNGSISAEHGLGFAKKGYVGYSRNETMLRLMRQIKSLYDPKGIMNPYKFI